MKERRDTGKGRFRKGVIQERIDSGKKDSGKEGCRKGWLQERRDAGKE